MMESKIGQNFSVWTKNNGGTSVKQVKSREPTISDVMRQHF